MKYSILIPVYNVEEYLKQCLETVFEQTYHDYEVIIIDDGSTDRSGRICDEFHQKYLDKSVLIHKKNQGLISARREAIKRAQGDYCIFVDSDDYVEKDLLEIINGYLNREKDIDILLYSYRYCRNGEPAERFPIFAQDGSIWEGEDKKLIYEKFACTSEITSIWTKAISTKILKEDPTDYVKYYGKDMSEDILQAIYPLTVAKRIMYTDNVLYNYRINEASISRSFYPETISKKNSLHVYNQIVKYLPIWGLDTVEMRKKLNARWFNDFMCMMSRYYENAKNIHDKRAIISYDWKTMIPDNSYDSANIYENTIYKKIYVWLESNNGKAINWHFVKKKCYQRLKKWKKKVGQIMKK